MNPSLAVVTVGGAYPCRPAPCGQGRGDGATAHRDAGFFGEAGGSAPGADGERELTARINAALSARILAAPESWVWMHERF